MPTINQLVRQGRKSAVKKSGSPALGKNMNNLKKTLTDVIRLKRGEYALQLRL